VWLAFAAFVLFINHEHRVVRQYGTTGVCRHDPPSELGSINGATPLPDGGTLVCPLAIRAESPGDVRRAVADVHVQRSTCSATPAPGQRAAHG
jgi:hypothetical protein